MLPFLADHPGNPSGGHAVARAAKTALEEAREAVAAVLGCRAGRGRVHRRRHRGRQPRGEGRRPARARAERARDGVVTTAFEHKGVLAAVRPARARGLPGRRGRRRRRAGSSTSTTLAARLDDRTAVVSVMLVNNEVGTIQPLAEVAALVRERAPAGACCTPTRCRPCRGSTSRALAAGCRPRRDLGPQVRRPEGRRRARRPRRRAARAADRGRRAGAGAARRARSTSPARSRSPTALRITHERRAEDDGADRARCATGSLDGLLDAVPDAFVNGDPRPQGRRATATSAFPGVEAEALLVAARPGRACARPRARRARRAPPSRRTCSRRWASTAPTRSASIRLSLGYASTDADVDRALERRSRAAVAQLRARRSRVSDARARGCWSR